MHRFHIIAVSNEAPNGWWDASWITNQMQQLSRLRERNVNTIKVLTVTTNRECLKPERIVCCPTEIVQWLVYRDLVLRLRVVPLFSGLVDPMVDNFSGLVISTCFFLYAHICVSSESSCSVVIFAYACSITRLKLRKKSGLHRVYWSAIRLAISRENYHTCDSMHIINPRVIVLTKSCIPIF